MNSKNEVVFFANQETDQISRALLDWLNQYPDKPTSGIDYEYLDADSVGMALSTVQSTYKTRQYITGGYQAQYQFKLIYRVQPMGPTGNEDRIAADGLLNDIADWASARPDKPDIGPGRKILRIESNTRSTLFARYQNGDEDHQIFMTMTYEVI